MVDINKLKPLIIIVGVSALLIVAIAAFSSWQAGPKLPALIDDPDFNLSGPRPANELERINEEMTNPMNPVAILSTNRGEIELELFADAMPVTVGNFIELARDGFYDGTKFHRVIEGFMIQGGDPNSRSSDSGQYGQGGPGYTIADEFISDPRLTNRRGTIAMANTGQPNSGGSQFFINTVDNTQLDFDKEPMSSRHPVFGRVKSGLEVIDEIVATPTDTRDVPIEPVVIESVAVVEAGA